MAMATLASPSLGAQPIDADAASSAGAVLAPLTNPAELRSQPRYISGDQPDEAPAALAAVADGRSGRVEVEATVTAAGRMQDIALVKPSGDVAVDEAVVTAVQGWKLSPGRDKDGRPVAVKAKFPFWIGAGFKRQTGAVPAFPDDAKALGHNGKVIARVTVNADGTLADIHIAESSRSPLLDVSVLAALATWRYAPVKNLVGQPDSLQIRLPFEFNQASGGGDNYLAGIKTYSCAAFLKESEWWVGAHPDKKLSDFPLYGFIRGLQLLTPELLGPQKPGAKMSAGYIGHPAQWENATNRCRAAPSSTFLAEYRKG